MEGQRGTLALPKRASKLGMTERSGKRWEASAGPSCGGRYQKAASSRPSPGLGIFDRTPKGEGKQE